MKEWRQTQFAACNDKLFQSFCALSDSVNNIKKVVLNCFTIFLTLCVEMKIRYANKKDSYSESESPHQTYQKIKPRRLKIYQVSILFAQYFKFGSFSTGNESY